VKQQQKAILPVFTTNSNSRWSATYITPWAQCNQRCHI